MNTTHRKPGDPYAPATGTELEAFEKRLCEHCEHEDMDVDDRFPCAITEGFYCRGVNVSYVPKEWTMDRRGRCECSAFEPKPVGKLSFTELMVFAILHKLKYDVLLDCVRCQHSFHSGDVICRIWDDYSHESAAVMDATGDDSKHARTPSEWIPNAIGETWCTEFEART